MQRIKTFDLVRAVKLLAANSPHTVYTRPLNPGNGPACSYTTGECSNGSKGCIIGQALKAAGIYKSVVASLDDTAGPITSLFAIPELAASFFGEIYPEHVLWIKRVQEMQDGGRTWEVAVAVADEFVSGLGLRIN